MKKCVLLLLLILTPLLPFIMFVSAIWLSDRTHEFGSYDPRYFLLVHGTAIDRLGVIAPQPGSIGYAARGRDGNSPAYVAVDFTTKIAPAIVIETYRSRCHAMRLSTTAASPGVPSLRCGDEIGISASMRGNVTSVRLGGWVF